MKTVVAIAVVGLGLVVVPAFSIAEEPGIVSSAVRPTTAIIIEVTPQMLEEAPSLTGMAGQVDTIAELKKISSGQSIIISLEIPSSLKQAIVQLHVSDRIESKDLAESLERLGFPPARKQAGCYSISPFQPWSVDERVAISEESVDTKRIALFAGGLRLQESHPLRVAVVAPEYFTRTLRETLPTLPDEFGGIETSVILNGAKWLSMGVSPKDLQFQLIAEGIDAAAAQKLAAELPRLVQATLTTLSADASTLEALQPLLAVLPSLLDVTHQSNRTRVTFSQEASASAVNLMQLAANVIEPIKQQRVAKKLKELGLAFHNYESANRSFPPGSKARDKDGKPRLSWRVHVLPYMGEGELYNAFHLDEPWDSEHNLTLLTKMPAIYAAETGTGQPQPKAGYSVVQAPVGEQTIAGSEKAVSYGQITDGTSNTILLVVTEADRAVPWTQPVDFNFAPDAPVQGLQIDNNGNFAAAFADGSVRRVPISLGNSIKGLFTMNGGEFVTW